MRAIVNQGCKHALAAVMLLTVTVWSVACSRHEVPTVQATEQDVIEAVLVDNSDSPAVGTRGLYSKSSTRLFWPGGRERYSALIDILRQEAGYKDRALQELVENYARANEVDIELVFPKKLPDNIILVPPGKDVRAAKDRFAGIEGVFEVSRVAIDAQQTTALVSMVYYKGINAAYGRFYVLKFDGKKWVVQKSERFGPSVMT